MDSNVFQALVSCSVVKDVINIIIPTLGGGISAQQEECSGCSYQWEGTAGNGAEIRQSENNVVPAVNVKLQL